VLIITVIIWIAVCMPLTILLQLPSFICGRYSWLGNGGHTIHVALNLLQIPAAKYPGHGFVFSFYDVTEKLAIVGGLFSFGFIEELTGSMRNSTLVLCGFFVIGLLLLFSLRVAEVNSPEIAEFSAE